jgi:hypothetical protein
MTNTDTPGTVRDPKPAMTRRTTVAVAISALAVAWLPLGLASSTAVADTTNGCPASWQLRSVDSLAATGNAPVPGQIDAAGNHDGFVCALPQPDAVCIAMGYNPCPVATLYNFRDNDLH